METKREQTKATYRCLECGGDLVATDRSWQCLECGYVPGHGAD